MDLATRKCHISRDVRFVEDKFPFSPHDISASFHLFPSHSDSIPLDDYASVSVPSQSTSTDLSSLMPSNLSSD